MIIFVSSKQLLSKNAICWHFKYLTLTKWRMIFQKFMKFYILKAKHYTRIIWKLRKKLLSNVWQKCTKKMKGTLFPYFIITKRKMTILHWSIPNYHRAQNIKMWWFLQKKSRSLPRKSQLSTSILLQLMEVQEYQTCRNLSSNLQWVEVKRLLSIRTVKK